ncbi:hypothetical protein [Pantoea agglomerans]|uniref:hypothetical protein n=1 Tax=Enterobacter agglomerans TaxID=549 RepID=UPI00077FE934|nr:hypothetical protein [Pantoea agglomerans]KYM75142.1 hypothetical protein A3L21_18455 [Pantoea agglomerans]
MLQISNGNFFIGDSFNETTHRSPLYTNMQFFTDSFPLIIGKIYKSNKFHDSNIVIAEVFEKQETHDSHGNLNVLISTSGHEMIDDFSLLISFYLNTLCTTSYIQATELLRKGQTSHRHIDPRKYIHRFFDESNFIQDEEMQELNDFMYKLLNTSRSSYETSMKAMRRYVTAMARIADDFNAAYALLVASIESLAQYHTSYETGWQDYSDDKRKPLDKILNTIDEDIANQIRRTIISQEHTGISRRFYSFVIDGLDENFYKTTDSDNFSIIGKRDLEIAIKSAYGMRSKYIHTLSSLPREITHHPTLNYMTYVNEKPFLTFNGLAAISRELIKKFVLKQDECKKEKIDILSILPNVITSKWAAEYWIGNKDEYVKGKYDFFLKGLLDKIELILKGHKGIIIPDMLPVLSKIEVEITKTKNSLDKCSMLTFYWLCAIYIIPREKLAESTFITDHIQYLHETNIYSLLMSAICSQEDVKNAESEWEFFKVYSSKKYNIKNLALSEYFESLIAMNFIAAFSLLGNEEKIEEIKNHIAINLPNAKEVNEFMRNYKFPAIIKVVDLYPKNLIEE